MKVLVTGHRGYIGSVLAPLLAEGGHDVTGLDLGLYECCDFGPDVGVVPGMRVDVRAVVASQRKASTPSSTWL